MRQLCKGNVAVMKGAILAGCRAYYGYPITPASEIAEAAALYLPQVGGTFLQAESEVAAINMVYGAAAAGVRVMSASSGPGISLMQEGFSYIAGAELPCVIVDVVRGGPGLGNIAPEQSDYFAMVKGVATVTIATWCWPRPPFRRWRTLPRWPSSWRIFTVIRPSCWRTLLWGRWWSRLNLIILKPRRPRNPGR